MTDYFKTSISKIDLTFNELRTINLTKFQCLLHSTIFHWHVMYHCFNNITGLGIFNFTHHLILQIIESINEWSDVEMFLLNQCTRVICLYYNPCKNDFYLKILQFNIPILLITCFVTTFVWSIILTFLTWSHNNG